MAWKMEKQRIQVPIQIHSIPAVRGSDADLLHAPQHLEDRGFLAMATRPPTIPAGSRRRRFILLCAHMAERVERILRAFGSLERAVA
jgi:7-keto-8-aminopelargonate synthetase-like enzyme